MSVLLHGVVLQLLTNSLITFDRRGAPTRDRWVKFEHARGTGGTPDPGGQRGEPYAGRRRFGCSRENRCVYELDRRVVSR
jgi:hypothetical protein